MSLLLLKLQKLFELTSCMFSAQLTTLWYRSTNCLAGLHLNIPLKTREWFVGELTFGATTCN
jgi:hypothetical protein